MRKYNVKIGKILIVFSAIILIIGLFFNIKENTKTKLLYNSKNDIHIPDTIINDSNSSNIISNSNEDNGESNNIDNNNISSFSNLNNLRDNIEKKYGITVKYGDETDDYVVGGYSTVSITNYEVIKNALEDLQETLSLYPDNFFKEMNENNLPLTVFLIQKFSSVNVTGITEKLKDNRKGVIVTIALDYPFVESFNHEIYHYIEHYIYGNGGSYTNWNNYNPTGFSYGTYDAKYVYDISFLEDSFFVNTYAQSYDYEDRASTFEYMMAPTKISPLNYGKNIWIKAKVIAETIDYYFSCVNDKNIEYWERFIY